MPRRALAALAVLAAVVCAAAVPPQGRPAVADRVMKLTRDSIWTAVSTVPVQFKTFHPQGMVKIGDEFIVSSVDKDLHVGHVFKIGPDGRKRADIQLGEGDIYHPGGIDYDGTNIWVPVGEYRRDSRSIIYRLDPNTMTATEVFRFADHIGAIVHNTDDHTLHGVSWGSRRFYRWTLAPGFPVTSTLNPSHYVDYQDCKYAGGRRMLCTGVTEIRQSPDGPPFRLGGMDLIDLTDGRPLHQVPVLLWTKTGFDMTHNPVWIETTATGLRGYFMPEDDQSTIYIYDVEVK
jgi:hypothetical protein